MGGYSFACRKLGFSKLTCLLEARHNSHAQHFKVLRITINRSIICSMASLSVVLHAEEAFTCYLRVHRKILIQVSAIIDLQSLSGSRHRPKKSDGVGFTVPINSETVLRLRKPRKRAPFAVKVFACPKDIVLNTSCEFQDQGRDNTPSELSRTQGSTTGSICAF